MNRLFALLGVLLFLPLHLGAQDARQQTTELRSGTRVRISAPSVSGQPLSGTAFFTTRDTIFLDRKHRPGAVIPVSAVESVEVSRGRDHWRGALYGAGIGGAVGGLIFGAMVASNEGASCDYCLFGNSFATGFTYGAVFVGVPAGLVGGIMGKERWQRITPPIELRVSPNLDGGTTAGVSLRIR